MADGAEASFAEAVGVAAYRGGWGGGVVRGGWGNGFRGGFRGGFCGPSPVFYRRRLWRLATGGAMAVGVEAGEAWGPSYVSDYRLGSWLLRRGSGLLRRLPIRLLSRISPGINSNRHPM